MYKPSFAIRPAGYCRAVIFNRRDLFMFLLRKILCGNALILTALLLAVGCSNPTNSFVEVTDVVNVPATGIAGQEIDLTVATVEPYNASNQTIVWSVTNPGTTGVSPGALTSGRVTPGAKGVLQITATIAGGLSSGNFSKTIPIVIDDNTAAKPAASPAAGEVAAGTTVTLSTTTEGAEIYYTTDGSDPDSAKTKYTAPIAINAALTIKAIAVKAGLTNSAVLEAAYTIAAPGAAARPAASPAAGEVAVGTTVTLSTSTAEAEIYYTTDGSSPNSTKNKYSTPITITAGVTIKAIAVKTGMTDSDILTAAYTVAAPETAARPSATPEAGEVAAGTTVALATTTEGAEIYYTIDGSVPDSTKTKYTGQITIVADVTIKAVAVKTGMTDSDILTAAYTVPPAGVKVQFTGPRDETITLSKMEDALSWADNTALNVSVSGTFSAYRWALDGVVIEGETGSSLSLNAGELSVSRHTLTVVVTKDGVEYSKVAQFTVGN
jgi:LysM repeat protein